MRPTRPVAKKATRLSLDDEIARLRDLDLHGLRALAVLAYRLQAGELGDLDPATARLLRQIATGGGTREASRRTEEFGRRRTELKPGTILMREWNAQTHRVMVVDDGFALNGKTYDSLSQVAFAITSTHWNGPRFFGLRDKISPEARS
jgi:D-serine deaminase-like pyridoxal phosphate-dependent protein